MDNKLFSKIKTYKFIFYKCINIKKIIFVLNKCLLLQVSHKNNSDVWILEVTPVTFRDAGVYECQVSTSPKISLPVYLHVEGM